MSMENSSTAVTETSQENKDNYYIKFVQPADSMKLYPAPFLKQYCSQTFAHTTGDVQ